MRRPSQERLATLLCASRYLRAWSPATSCQSPTRAQPRSAVEVEVVDEVQELRDRQLRVPRAHQVLLQPRSRSEVEAKLDDREAEVAAAAAVGGRGRGRRAWKVM
jgi:hypothetical protein